jgi:hypothetical protein
MAGNNRSTAEFTEADGRQLAVDMLRELREWTERVNERECDKMSDDEDEPDMREVILGEEPEIFRRYLATMQSKNSAALERGFLCVLSHFMAEFIEDSEIEGYDGYVVPRPGLQIQP